MTESASTIDHFEGTCDVCGAPISLDFDRATGIVDIQVAPDGRVGTWMRHYATAPPGANPDCARYSSSVWLTEPESTDEPRGAVPGTVPGESLWR